MITDLNQQSEQWSNEYGHLVGASSFFYFTRNTELWKSNGVYGGEVKLKTFKSISNLTMCGNTLYFAADDGSGVELWKSNGWPSNTHRVKDIYPGTSSSLPQHLTDVNGVLYFTAISPGVGRELWKSNGTAAGTGIVKDVFPKGGGSNPAWLTNVNGTLFFAANDGTRGYELWKTDGTDAGTVCIRDIRTEYRVSSSPEQLTAAGDNLFFVCNDGTAGKELWKSNGTSAGTVRVKDIMAGSKSPGIENITAVNSSVFFTASDGIHGHELWKSNGTATGTVLVKDMTPGPSGSHGEEHFSHRMGSFKNIKGALFYTAYQGPDYYIWKSDGTTAGTIPLEIAMGFGILQPNAMFTYMNGYIYYFNVNYHGADWFNLMKMDLNGNSLGSLHEFYLIDFYNAYYPMITTVADRNLYIVAKGWHSGFSIWKSNGTWEGTGELLDVQDHTVGSGPMAMINFKGKVYFQTSMRETDIPYYYDFYPLIYRTDGTEAGTEPVEWGTNMQSIISNDRLFISSTEYGWDTHISMFDAAGTHSRLKEFPEDVSIVKLAQANGNVFFFTSEGEVWRTNGTATGTLLLKAGQQVTSFNTIGSTLVYHVLTPTGEELWKSNGTPGGTVKVKTIRSTSGIQSRAYPSVVHNGILYFVANDGVHGNEIWRTNGTNTGTYMVFDINGNDKKEWDNNEYDISGLHIFQNELYMSVRQITYSSPGVVATDKWELRHWKPGESSTGVVGEIDAASTMMSDANVLYFMGVNPASHLVSLWAYQPAIATPLQKLHEFGDSRNIDASADYAFINDELILGTKGYGLWRSKGTPCSTTQIPMAHNYAYGIEQLGSNLILGAYAEGYDVEPHVYPISTFPSPPTCDEAMAATETLAAESVTISSHPNPFNEYFKIRVSTTNEEPLKLMVFKMDGTPVEQIESLQTSTDYEIGKQWAPGWHVVRAVTKSGVYITKVMKK
jgi:ELWxxDGT repeat protein